MRNYACVVAEDMVNVIVDCAAVPVLVKHLQAPPLPGREGEGGPRLYEHEVEKGSAFTLGLLAIKVTTVLKSSRSLWFIGSFSFLIKQP